MLMSRCFLGLVAVAILLTPVRAHAAFDLFWGKSSGERLVEQAASARERTEFRLAASLLDEAETQARPPTALILRERGLLQQARGDLEDAARLLGEAALREPSSGARLDQAAVMVQLGRWPEAVVTLKRAFVERGSALPVDDVIADTRFASLSGFEPYELLLTETRAEQAGFLGRFLLRVERIEASVAVAAKILDQVAAVSTMVWRVARAAGAAVIALILLGFLIAAGVSQLGMLKPPWPLVAGMLVASSLWHLGARVGSADQSNGLGTIGLALLIVFGPWLLFEGGLALWRHLRRRRQRRDDPFEEPQLLHTLALLEESAALGRRMLAAPKEDRAKIGADQRQAERQLRERLHSGS